MDITDITYITIWDAPGYLDHIAKPSSVALFLRPPLVDQFQGFYEAIYWGLPGLVIC